MKTTLNPFENAKRTADGTGGASPSVIEEIQAEITVLGSQNETQAQDITDIKGSLNSINDNLTQYDMDNAQYLTDKFRFATKDGKDGYIKKVSGADTFFPFSPKADLLWTNPNPSTEFNSQTIGINLTKYESILITIRNSVSSDNLTDCIGYFKKGATISGCIGVARPIPSTNAAFGTRLVTSVSDTGVTFGVFKYGTTLDNNLGIPVKIYGLRNDLIPS